VAQAKMDTIITQETTANDTDQQQEKIITKENEEAKAEV